MALTITQAHGAMFWAWNTLTELAEHTDLVCLGEALLLGSGLWI